MTNNDQDAKIKLVANIRLDRARLYSFENKTRNSKDQKRRKKNPRYAQPATPNHKAEKHQRGVSCNSVTSAIYIVIVIRLQENVVLIR